MNTTQQTVLALALGILGGFLGAWGGLESGLIPAPAPKVATFDVTRFINAERAVASGLLSKKGDNAQNAAIVLAKVSKLVKSTIQEEAGPNTLILVKQGVVAGTAPDITSAVLKKLGLPTKEPTQSPMHYATQIAPTDISEGMVLQAQNAKIKQSWAITKKDQAKVDTAVNQAALP